jgi:hypothetical protein
VRRFPEPMFLHPGPLPEGEGVESAVRESESMSCAVANVRLDLSGE